jgi:alpha-galactosidase
MHVRFSRLLLVVTVLAASGTACARNAPLKVYVLAGQSNMQGQANVKTLPHMAEDPASKALHDKIVDGEGKPRVYEDVRVAYLSGGRGGPQEKHGPLTTGFGSGGTKEDVLGPELGFGITMYERLRQPILLIKTAWGGKSINTDFRPPSAGPYPFSEQQIESAKTRHKITVEELKAKKAKATGHYYRLMTEFVRKVLADPGKYHPAYDPDAGYEVAGFVWFQGWNDMVDGGTYPNRYKPGGYEKYTEVLAHFIRDVRKEFNAPTMPFVIGVMGVGGPTKDYESPRYKGVHRRRTSPRPKRNRARSRERSTRSTRRGRQRGRRPPVAGAGGAENV